MWKTGRIAALNGEVYSYEAKVYEEGSVFGINEGRVSKLQIKDRQDRVVANYDRGWDVEPQSEAVGFVVYALVSKYK